MVERLLELVRFCVVGLTCLGLGLAILAGLHEMAGADYLIAYIVAFVVTSLAGYWLNARFTFSLTSVGHAGAARYLMVNAVLLCANAAAFKILVAVFHLWYIAAAILLAAVNTPVSFLAQRLVTYRLELRDRSAGT